ncbi:sodium/potassium-transporting ATPase subunit beta-1-interacting protein 4 [Hetaerina americana]|uniref:sodium/potassium-transporting ATPase subunit beta-1-interacting protein 4 n=1 Tax=Hetaerina americana TaxID=62018 RepID=UPI003A7F4AD6
MGFCTRRHFLLVILVLQMVATIERQVFDFLGFMWAPILANFFQMVFVIFGFFGAYQYRSKYIIAFCIWSIVWIGWNIFVICFYLNVGILNRDGDALNMGTGSTSWWEVNGAGCHPSYASPSPTTSPPPSPSTFFPLYATGDQSEDGSSAPFETVLPSVVTLSDVKDDFAPYRPLRPSSVTGCLLQYEHVEVLHAAIHCLLAALAMSAGVCLTHGLLSEDDNFTFAGGFGPVSPSSYYHASPRLSTPSLTLLPPLPSPLSSPLSSSPPSRRFAAASPPSTPRVLLGPRRGRVRQGSRALYSSLGEGFVLGAFGEPDDDSPYSERKGLMTSSPSRQPAGIHGSPPSRLADRCSHGGRSKGRLRPISS